jgi:hypothetical protein
MPTLALSAGIINLEKCPSRLGLSAMKSAREKKVVDTLDFEE